MRRRITIAGMLSIVAGCNGDAVSTGQSPRPQEPLPPVSAYRLVGTIRDENDLAIRGASVTLTDVAMRSLQTVSDSAGHFEFQGVTGVFTVLVRYENYHDIVSYLFISSDRVLNVRMVRVVPELVFELGKEYNLVVHAGDDPCDPAHWDAQAPCRRIRFQASQTGTLKVQVTWASEGEVDFTIMRRRKRISPTVVARVRS